MKRGQEKIGSSGRTRTYPPPLRKRSYGETSPKLARDRSGRERRWATLRLTAGSHASCRMLLHVAAHCRREPISRGVKILPLAGTSRGLLGVAASCGAQKARKRQTVSRRVGDRGLQHGARHSLLSVTTRAPDREPDLTGRARVLDTVRPLSFGADHHVHR